jgi:hypothetical protein
LGRFKDKKGVPHSQEPVLNGVALSGNINIPGKLDFHRGDESDSILNQEGQPDRPADFGGRSPYSSAHQGRKTQYGPSGQAGRPNRGVIELDPAL